MFRSKTARSLLALALIAVPAEGQSGAPAETTVNPPCQAARRFRVTFSRTALTNLDLRDLMKVIAVRPAQQ